MKKYLHIFIIAITIISSLFLHRHIFNKDIIGVHSWRQCQTEWNIRNFYRHDANILNPRVSHFNGGKDNIYRYEFPVMQWAIGMLHKAFGESIAITRYAMLLIGFFGLFGFYRLLRSLNFEPLIASFGMWAFSFSPVFYYYTVNPLPDLFALSMGIWYLYFFYKSTQNQDFKYIYIAAMMLSLATLAKLPFIVFGGATFVYLLRQLFKNGKTELSLILKHAAIYIGLMLFPLLWYAWVIPTWQGNGIVAGLFDNQISWEKAKDILRYHKETMFPLILLNKACWFFFTYALFVFFKEQLFKRKEIVFMLFPFILVCFYFIFELNMIDKVHDYYMFPFLPFLFIIVAYGIKVAWRENYYIKTFVLISLLSMVSYCLKQNANSWTVDNAVNSGFNKDIFMYQKELTNAVPRDEKCIILNDHSMFVFSYLIDKQGFIFKDNYLPTGWIVDMVQNHNVRYMYSDSRAIENDANVKQLIDSIVLEAGSIKVLKLKNAATIDTLIQNKRLILE
jgi:hypothetical protein